MIEPTDTCQIGSDRAVFKAIDALNGQKINSYYFLKYNYTFANSTVYLEKKTGSIKSKDLSGSIYR
jgi:hypothetical protein